MKKCEILSPVGDTKGFYVAIANGADAVYMGLPKFNARMKAENITMETLPKLVRYAHLKDVKVYITLNTLLKDNEISQAIEMVGDCLKYGVDAFIVQDMGLIRVLKRVYPSIVLHGSTQLGIHNVRGAKVAKEIGLSRIVLSRECTLEDIISIRANVDIELEVFVQGAMCVCFSGNCYMSSIKCDASGNRGECKQLCRLPYILSDGKVDKKGYVLSPRDNCMLDYIAKFMSLGIESLKIEGRLRNTAYISTATHYYREAVDLVAIDGDLDIARAKSKLAEVFSRGEFISGYLNGNNIIDTVHNSHLGNLIGSVTTCEKFKSLFKVTMSLNSTIETGDGLKFINGKNIVTLGVGNYESIGNNYTIYSKNPIDIGSKIYKTFDTTIEKRYNDISHTRNISMKFIGQPGQTLKLYLKSKDCEVMVEGGVCEKAETRGIDAERIISQLSKVDTNLFNISDIQVETFMAYIPVSAINELRRQGIEKLTKKICANVKVKPNDVPEIITRTLNFNKLAIADEKTTMKYLIEYDAVIFSPMVYSIANIDNLYKTYRSYTNAPFILDLPVIARVEDLKVIDAIVDRYKNENVMFVANNIYALDYVKYGAKVIAGAGLNVINEQSASAYLELGATEIINSIEKWSGRLSNTYKIIGRPVLMTFAHCPYKTLNGNDCKNCTYIGNLSLQSNASRYIIRRKKIASCYFELVDIKTLGSGDNHIIFDLR